MQDLTVTIVQDALDWEQPDANRARFTAWLDQAGPTDLIVLPEMFSTGFTMNPASIAESMDGPTVAWMREQAAARDAVITGSIVIADQDRHYNRLLWVSPDGGIEHYDKRHLFRMAGEDKVYAPGRDRMLTQLNGWVIAPFICYDLRFPVWSRRRNDYDIALYVANWPAPRHDAWSTLLKARAMENQSYVIGVNRIGTDDNGIDYPGGSVVLDYLGRELAACSDKAKIKTTKLSRESLDNARQRFPVAHDADAFSLE